MNDPTYRVVFAGKPLAGFDRDTAIDNFARLFKREPAQAQAAFAGKPLVVKKALPAADAEKYCRALEKAGLAAYAEPEAPPASLSLAPVDDAPAAAPGSDARPALSLSLQDDKSLAAPAAPPAPAPVAAPVISASLSLVGDDEHKPAAKTPAGAATAPGAPAAGEMTCPACGHVQPKAEICSACRVVIAKYLQRKAEKERQEAERAVQEAARAQAQANGEPEAAAATALPKLFAVDVDGRLGRVRFLAWNLPTMAAMAGALFVVGLLGAASPLALVLMLPVLGAALFLFVRLAVLRLHDRGQTGWLAAILVVPLVNIGMMLYLVFAPGDSGENAHGAPPSPNTPLAIAGAVAYVVMMVAPLFFLPAMMATAMQQAMEQQPAMSAEEQAQLDEAIAEMEAQGADPRLIEMMRQQAEAARGQDAAQE